MLTVPPTGTTSILHGVSSGIEPIFSAMYNRRRRVGSVWKSTFVVDPLFKEYFNNRLPLNNFVGAYDIAPEDHIQVQATIQKYVDSCISKTINLPETATAEDFSKSALNFAPYIKGMTVYKAGSRGEEPLEAIPLTKENIAKYMSSSVESEATTGEACSLAGGNCGE